MKGRQNNIVVNESSNVRLTIDSLNFKLNSLSEKEMKSMRGEDFDSLTGGETGLGFLINGYVLKNEFKINFEKFM